MSILVREEGRGGRGKGKECIINKDPREIPEHSGKTRMCVRAVEITPEWTVWIDLHITKNHYQGFSVTSSARGLSDH